MPQRPADTADHAFCLCATYAAQRAEVLRDPGAPPRTALDDERGWLVTQGVARLVEPFVTHLPDDDADLARYAGLDASAAGELLGLLTPEQLADRQNDAPTLGALLRAATDHPDDVEVHGYLVGPARTDERITAEGVDLYGLHDLEPVWAVAQTLGITGARREPDAVVARVNPWRPYEPCWRLWWD